jgi:hypothetical protein
MNGGDDARKCFRLKAILHRREDPHLYDALAALDVGERALRHRFLVRHGFMFADMPLRPLLPPPRWTPEVRHNVTARSIAESDNLIRLDTRMYKLEDPHLCKAFDALKQTDRPRFHKFLLRHGFVLATLEPSAALQWLSMTPGTPPAPVFVPRYDDAPELVANTAGLSGELDF